MDQRIDYKACEKNKRQWQLAMKWSTRKLGELLKEFGAELEKTEEFHNTLYTEVTKKTERALLSLLKDNVEFLYIDYKDPFYFHKGFRQTDVTESGHVDSAIWCLLQYAPRFWKVFNKMFGDLE